MAGGLLNYTTSIEASKSVGEIMELLQRARAQSVMTEYSPDGEIAALSFRLMTPSGLLTFRMPADIAAVGLVMHGQAQKGNIPKRFGNDLAQARRVAWRILKDWLAAQLALIETNLAKAEQVLLPYAQHPDTGKTVYETFAERKNFDGLALPAPFSPGGAPRG